MPSTTKPAYAKPSNPIGDVPFQGDLFKRKEFARKLTLLLDQLSAGCVIGIDGEWGTGKTWFGRNWAAQLAASGHKTIYLDAFEQDYTEDAFIPISAEILAALNTDDDQGRGLLTTTINLGKALLPSTAKIGLNVIGKFLGTSDLSETVSEVITEAETELSDVAEKYIASRIKGLDAEKETIAAFRSQLESLASSQDKPVIFIIDELDRCRPTFAVQIIERIKHFFDVKNLIFVLLVNRKQLEQSISGVYGPIDAQSYLGKFVTIYLGLPPVVQLGTNHNKTFLRHLAMRYNFESSSGVVDFIGHFSVMATDLGMSFRDLEKAMTYFAIANDSWKGEILAWPIALKVARVDLYNSLIKKDPDALGESSKLLTVLNKGQQHGTYFLARAYTALAMNNANEEQKQFLNSRYFGMGESLLWATLQSIDVSIQD